MLIPAFQLHLQERVQRGLATIGRFDAQHASLAGATHAGKVFVHSPHDPSGQRRALLNINKQITALVAGAILPSSTRDVLLIGSPNTLQCYDIERNRDLFFKDISEGVSCVVAGSYGSYTRPLAIVGGNCSVQGFDSDGNDVFWSVTGDVVSALALADIDGDGRNELLVGCDDFEIRIFKDEDLILQITEADQITGLAHLGGPRFAYALRNGTIGVYDGATRLWRVKSKHSVAGILAFDLDGDGQPELVSGWSNGRVEARHAVTGEVVHHDSLGAGVAALLRGDLRGLGSEELVAVGTQGEVRGYATQSDELHVDAGDISMQQRTLVDLAQKKQELMHELAGYLSASPDPGGGGGAAAAAAAAAALPPDTRVDSAITINKASLVCELTLSTTNDSVIKAAMIFGEQVFEGESLLSVPAEPERTLTVPLAPARDAPVVLMIKALVGTKGSSLFHVFEIEMEMPKYAMYAAVEGSGNSRGSYGAAGTGVSVAAGPGAALYSGGGGSAAAAAAAAAKLGSVTFDIRHPLQRIAAWVESRFSTKPTVLCQDSLEAYFTGLRDRRPVGVKAAPAPSGGAGGGGALGAAAGGGALQVTIMTDDMDLAGDLLQDLASYLGLDELASRAAFPADMDAFKATLAQVEELSAARSALAADVADASALLKALVVRAEDARLLGDMAAMRKAYRQLYDLNRDLISDHDKRATNHQQLLQGLRGVNRMIQRAARLRVGPPQARAVAACRAAVKQGNVQALARIVRDGEAPSGSGAG